MLWQIKIDTEKNYLAFATELMKKMTGLEQKQRGPQRGRGERQTGDEGDITYIARRLENSDTS